MNRQLLLAALGAAVASTAVLGAHRVPAPVFQSDTIVVHKSPT